MNKRSSLGPGEVGQTPQGQADSSVISEDALRGEGNRKGAEGLREVV